MWIRTESDGYVDLEKAYTIFIKLKPVGPSGCGEFNYLVIAKFLISSGNEDGFSPISLLLKEFGDKKDAAGYLDSIIEKLQ